MSRGPGSKQRAILAVLADGEWHSPYDVALAIHGPAHWDLSCRITRDENGRFGTESTAALIEASDIHDIRRSLRGLAAQGRIEASPGTFSVPRAASGSSFDPDGVIYRHHWVRTSGTIYRAKPETDRRP